MVITSFSSIFLSIKYRTTASQIFTVKIGISNWIVILIRSYDPYSSVVNTLVYSGTSKNARIFDEKLLIARIPVFFTKYEYRFCISSFLIRFPHSKQKPSPFYSLEKQPTMFRHNCFPVNPFPQNYSTFFITMNYEKIEIPNFLRTKYPSNDCKYNHIEIVQQYIFKPSRKINVVLHWPNLK